MDLTKKKKFSSITASDESTQINKTLKTSIFIKLVDLLFKIIKKYIFLEIVTKQ